MLSFIGSIFRVKICVCAWPCVCISVQKCNQKILWEKRRKKSENYQFIPIIMNIWEERLEVMDQKLPLALLWIIVDSHKPRADYNSWSNIRKIMSLISSCDFNSFLFSTAFVPFENNSFVPFAALVVKFMAQVYLGAANLLDINSSNFQLIHIKIIMQYSCVDNHALEWTIRTSEASKVFIGK